MFKVGDFVAITAGPWAGHRGLIQKIEPRIVLVSLLRPSAAGRHTSTPGTVPTVQEHYVAPEHIAHLDVI